MNSILQDRKECYITRRPYPLEEHHIYYGHGKREISEKHGFKVWLTPELHRFSNESVHLDPDRKLDLRLKRECQAKFEETHSRAEFMALIGHNYLDDDMDDIPCGACNGTGKTNGAECPYCYGTGKV